MTPEQSDRIADALAVIIAVGLVAIAITGLLVKYVF